MAQAVLEIHPEAKIAIGPPIDNGFYYDFDLGKDENGKTRTFTPEELEQIEKRMRQIIAGKHPFVYRQVSADEARQLFADQVYKLELIEGLEKGGIDEYGNETAEKPVISTYRQDTFEDLCRGPHLEHTGQIPADAFKLMSVAGAYWRGDEKNPMLQRIYGTAWRNKKDLKAHLTLLEEAKKRDHRKLGRELEIFIFDEEVGPGLPLWLPNGGVMIAELERLAAETEHEGRLPARQDAAPDEGRPLPAQRAPALLRREHVPADGAGGRALLCQADELPLPSQDFWQQVALLPRPAGAPGRVWHLLPLRKERRVVRPDARALDADERRPHLLHARSSSSRSSWPSLISIAITSRSSPSTSLSCG
jgi:hypothetical protein